MEKEIEKLNAIKISNWQTLLNNEGSSKSTELRFSQNFKNDLVSVNKNAESK